MSKRHLALIVGLLCALVYVAVAPFNPVAHFSIGGVAIVVLVWAIISLRNEIIKGDKQCPVITRRDA